VRRLHPGRLEGGHCDGIGSCVCLKEQRRRQAMLVVVAWIRLNW
jgi:hypothetical protein